MPFDEEFYSAVEKATFVCIPEQIVMISRHQSLDILLLTNRRRDRLLCGGFGVAASAGPDGPHHRIDRYSRARTRSYK